MGKKGKPGPFPEMGDRIAKIRKYLCGDRHGDQKAFAQAHGFSEKQWNHWENGHSIPWPQAVRMVEKFPMLTLDYIYRADFRGMSAEVMRELRERPRGR